MPAPAPLSTITLWPWWTSSRTLPGTSPTRYSWVLIYFGTPTSMIVSSLQKCPARRAGGPVIAIASSSAQSMVFSTSPRMPTISSICFFSQMSGGDSAMMSPVVRISRFLS